MTTKKRAAKGSSKVSHETAMKVATNMKAAPKQRVKAMAQSPLAVCETDDNLQAILAVVRNKEESVHVRLAAMDTLATAAFSAVKFASCRNDYIATLREVTDDPNPEIRETALGALAGERDPFVQKKVLEGLKNPEKALVPPDKALQLLSYDVHTEAYAVARDIVNTPPNDNAKTAALRLLAADAKSAPLFEKLLRDKDEKREVRQLSASALNALNPDKLQEHAKEILQDESEYEDIQATSLTALKRFADEEEITNDKALMKSINRLSTKAKSAKYKKSAKQFLKAYAEKDEKEK